MGRDAINRVCTLVVVSGEWLWLFFYIPTSPTSPIPTWELLFASLVLVVLR